MPVYVDPPFEAPPAMHWPYKRACHLYADTREELHEMAGLIGLSRSWFQDRLDFPHYDLTVSKRQQAIARGAVATDREHARQTLERNRAQRLKAEGRKQNAE